MSQEKYILLGDSLIKYINRTKHTRVMAFPGARAHDLMMKIYTGAIRVEQYQIAVCAVGTNDASDTTMPCMLAADGIMMLMSQIAAANPHCILVYSAMLIRPKDLGTSVEYRRRLINSIIQKKCKGAGYYFYKTWKCLMTQSNIRHRVYARDGLHLNQHGARHVWRRIEGNIRALEGGLRL
jgi:hypothetical protein